MIVERVDAAMGRRPFDVFLKNVRIVNVFDDTITEGSIGIIGDRIAFVGTTAAPDRQANEVIDGRGRYVLPGFIDSHMHLESSFLSPSAFAEAALSCGTTTVAADPHEIANAAGFEGVRALAEASRGLPLRILLEAPSTVPSAPGFEGSGYDVGPEEIDHLLSLPGVCGLGEVMNFNGVADGDEKILSVIEAAERRGVLLDGHASVLTGRRLQAFRAAGIDSDHTTACPEKLREELALGFTVQIQECVLTAELVTAMNKLPIQNRVCLVTDDVPLPRLMHEGHLNYVARRAIALGLDPLKAIRFCTINPADRLRLYDTGALVPGRRAELMLVEDLRELRPSLVMTGGVPVWQKGVFSVRLPFGSGKDVWGAALRDSLRLERFSPADFEITCAVPPDFQGGRALVNLIGQDGVSLRTKREQREVPLNLISPGLAKPDTSGLLRMTVWNRYGEHRHGTALVGGMEEFSGALALTYGHDSHNLSVYGSDPDDMAAAANALLETHGGICAVQGRKVLALVPLPLAGLLSEKRPAELLKELDAFLEACNRMGFRRRDPLSLLTLLPLAVSMEIRCTDKGLLDVANRRFLPLVEKIEEGTI